MKKNKKLLILLIILAAVIVAAFAANKYQEHKESIDSTAGTIESIEYDSVTAISWTNDGNSLSFTKKDGTWTYDDDETFPVDESSIQSLIAHFESFGYDFKIEDVDDYSQYGLDDPTCTITITTDDETYEIKLGNYSTIDEERYASIDDGNAYLLTEDILDYFGTDISSFIENDEIPTLDNISEVTVETSDETYSFSNKKDSNLSYCVDDIYFTDDDKALDSSKVEDYMNTLKYLSLTDYATYNATDDDLATYGLDDPELTLTIKYKTDSDSDSSTDSSSDDESESKTFVVHIGRNADEVKAAEEKRVSENSTDTSSTSSSTTTTSTTTSSSTDSDEYAPVYLRVGDSKIIYKITETNYETLIKAAYDDLRHDEVVSASFSDVEKIDVSLNGKSYTFTSKEDGSDTKWYYDDSEIDISDIQTACQALTVSEFTDEESGDDEEISFTLYLDNDKFPEINVKLLRVDGTNCYAIVDDENIGLVSRSEVVDMIEAVNAIILN